MKATVLYFSRSGKTERMAGVVAKGMAMVEDVEARTFSIADIDAAFVKESDCVILGTPVYFATFAGPVKTWFEESARALGLPGKLGGAFATADYVHGGGEVAIQGILSHMMVMGMPVYSGGGAFGKPVIHLGPVALGEGIERYDETFTLFGKRMAEQAAKLFGK